MRVREEGYFGNKTSRPSPRNVYSFRLGFFLLLISPSFIFFHSFTTFLRFFSLFMHSLLPNFHSR